MKIVRKRYITGRSIAVKAARWLLFLTVYKRWHWRIFFRRLVKERVEYYFILPMVGGEFDRDRK